jgi:hypothetical protein
LTEADNEKHLVTEKESQNTTLLDRTWPTERSTYHLGGTRYWELDFEITEPPDECTTTAKIRTVTAITKVITKTTCFHIVFKNEGNNITRKKRYIHYYKRNIYDNHMKKSNDQHDTSLKNITGNNMLLYIALTTKQPDIKIKKLENSLQKLREANHYKQNFNRKQKMKLNAKFLYNEDPVIAKNRKLCGVNKNKSKHQIRKHKDTMNVNNRKKKRQLGKQQKSMNINPYFLKNCTDSCIVNKKKLDKYHKAIVMRTTEHHYLQIKNNKNGMKTHRSSIADHKNKSTSKPFERKIHDCLNCICDIVSVINSIRFILAKTSFSLEEIKALNCSRYKETRENIVISTDSDIEEIKTLPQPHYNTESLKGQKYIKLEELEDDFKNDLEFDNGTVSFVMFY